MSQSIEIYEEPIILDLSEPVSLALELKETPLELSLFPGGEPGKDGRGVPTGGGAGEVLAKRSDEDYDTEWIEGGGGSLPEGGSAGQLLAKRSAADGDVEWTDPIPGPQGPTGPQGPVGPAGPQGADGQDGADGQGVPQGGTAGQVLRKRSSADFDALWTELPEELPSGGGEGSPLVKASAAEGDVIWESDSGWTKITTKNLTYDASGGLFFRRRGDMVYVKLVGVKLKNALAAGYSVDITDSVPSEFDASPLCVFGMSGGRPVTLAKSTGVLRVSNLGTTQLGNTSLILLNANYYKG